MIEISTTTHLLTNLVANHPKMWIKLGNAESRLLAPELSDITITSPIWISGLARSGSTILLQMLADHADTATHTYGDFPFLFTPCWWNAARKFSRGKNGALKERAHGDGIFINQHSPEAMEEMLWMVFFSYLHQPNTSHILDTTTQNPMFECFYRDHIRKILHLRNGRRYTAKANYSATRLVYLHKLFPDARFIVPIRHPVAHVESLMRQHRRFTQAAAKNPRIVLQMQAGGHFEFGPHRAPIHTGDTDTMQEVLKAANEGNDAKYYALQWDMLYRFLYQQMHHEPALAKTVLVVPFEEYCAKSYDILQDVFSHCRLSIDEKDLRQKATSVRTPSYESGLTTKEIALINDICNETAQSYGY